MCIDFADRPIHSLENDGTTLKELNKPNIAHNLGNIFYWDWLGVTLVHSS